MSSRAPGDLGEPATGRGALRFLWNDAGQTAIGLWLLAALFQLTTGIETLPLLATAVIGIPLWIILRVCMGSKEDARQRAKRQSKLPPPP